LTCLFIYALTYKPNNGGNNIFITIDVWIIMKYCVRVISFNPLANNLYKYITKLLVFNLMNLTCLNDVMIFITNIYMELIWRRENLNLFLDVSNQSNFIFINSNSWNKVHKTHDPFTTLIYSQVLSTWSHTSFDNTKNVQLINLVA
jgi:hypothetical protein